MLRRVRARLDRDFGEGAVAVATAGRRGLPGAGPRAEPGAGQFCRERQGPQPLDRLSQAVGDLRAAALVAARRVRADGQHQAGRVRDGAGHASAGCRPRLTRWLMDLFTRCVLGLRVTPVSTKSVDARLGAVQEALGPPEVPEGWPPGGGLALSRGARDAGRGCGPGRKGRVSLGPPCCPTLSWSITGSIYLSEHVTSACARLGISVQPAPALHADRQVAGRARFFRTLGEGLLEGRCPGLQGAGRVQPGEVDCELDAFFYLGELEAIIREWVAVVYHRRPHDSLTDPRLPGLTMSPVQRFPDTGIAPGRAGSRSPATRTCGWSSCR